MKKLRYLILSCIFITKASAQVQSTQVNTQIDLVYKKVGDWIGKLDLYVPQNNGDKPLVVYVHGGGWVHGQKEAEYEKIQVFIEHGYPVANLAYRLAREAPAPAAAEDVYCALRYLNDHAKKLGLGKRKVVLMGGSAGAHLALLVGLQSSKPIFTGDCGLKTMAIAAIISKYGPTDLTTWKPAFKEGSASAAWLGNRKGDINFVKSVSPINYTANNQIPVLFIHGDQDQTVPISQSEMLYEQLKQDGHHTEFHRVPGGKHGNFTPAATEVMNQKMLAFLKEISDR